MYGVSGCGCKQGVLSLEVDKTSIGSLAHVNPIEAGVGQLLLYISLVESRLNEE